MKSVPSPEAQTPGRPEPRPRRWANWLLLLGSTVFAIGAAELAVRILDLDRPPLFRTVEGDQLFEPDSLLGWRSIPNSRYRVSSVEYDFQVANNSLGFRGPEPPAEGEQTGGCRILIVGDSFVQGLTVRYEDTFGQVAESLIERESGQDCSVVSAGVEGYNTVQEYLFLKRDLARYRPSLVVLFFFFNDVWCNVSEECGGRAGGRSVIGRDTGPGVPPLELPPLAMAAPQAGPLDRASESILSRVRVLRMVTRGIAGLARGGFGHGVPLRSTLFNEPMPGIMRVFQRTYAPAIDTAWQTTAAYLGKMKALSEELGARFLVFHVPIRESIYADQWTTGTKRLGLSDTEWSVGRVDGKLREICDAEALNCLFPADRFRQAAGSPPPLYLRNDPHWSVDGHRLVGRILAEAWLASRAQ